ncbi:MAG: YhcN/YlaJ family sporulation lipoprotein [Tumebacillaceae bacterium]
MMKQLALPAILIAALLSGCSPNAAPQTNERAQKATPGDGVQDQASVKSTPAERNPDPKTVSEIHKPVRTERAPKIASRPDGGAKTLTQQADEIAQTVTRIPGVERAAVLIAGKAALVGVDLNATITGSKIDSIKYSVKEAAERTGNGYHAIVSSDIDTVTRTRELINGIRQGRPVSSVSDEVADIVSRLLPEM